MTKRHKNEYQRDQKTLLTRRKSGHWTRGRLPEFLGIWSNSISLHVRKMNVTLRMLFKRPKASEANSLRYDNRQNYELTNHWYNPPPLDSLRFHSKMEQNEQHQFCSFPHPSVTHINFRKRYLNWWSLPLIMKGRKRELHFPSTSNKVT